MSKKSKYLSLPDVMELHPDGNYKVVGEIQKAVLKKHEIEEIIESTYLKPVGYHNQSRYKVLGYVNGRDDGEYILVLKDVRKQKILWKILLLVAFIIGGYFIWKMNQGPDIDPSIEDYVSNLKRPDDLDETRILVPGYSELYGEVGSKSVSVALFNPDDNPCYFQFTIIERSKNEELYTSKLIPPGKGIKGIQLEREMPKGTYDIIIRIKSYDLNDYKEEFNGAEVEAKLIVK